MPQLPTSSDEEITLENYLDLLVNQPMKSGSPGKLHMSETTDPNDQRMSLVRTLAAYDRESENHKKIYQDLADE